MSYFYLNVNGSVYRKEDSVVQAAGGAREVFNQPHVEAWWFLDEERLQPQELACMENADHWTCVRGRNPRDRSKMTFGSIEECLAYASAFPDKKTMIYAITAEGRDAHILNA